MGVFRKKADPISDRSKVLSAQIASLEAEIRRLDQTLHQPAKKPGSGNTNSVRNGPMASSRRGAALSRQPVFEAVERHPLAAASEPAPGHFNDLGVRKYDLAGAWQRFRSFFRGPPATNPKLVTYLAAGSIRGLRPLRYEKRVARNRFIALLLILVGLLWGIFSLFVRTH